MIQAAEAAVWQRGTIDLGSSRGLAGELLSGRRHSSGRSRHAHGVTVRLCCRLPLTADVAGHPSDIAAVVGPADRPTTKHHVPTPLVRTGAALATCASGAFYIYFRTSGTLVHPNSYMNS